MRFPPKSPKYDQSKYATPAKILTEILLLESIVREEGHPGVRDYPQDSRPVAPVQRPGSLALPNLDEHLPQRPVAGVLVRHGHPRPRQIQRVGHRLRRDARQRSRQEPAHFGAAKEL